MPFIDTIPFVKDSLFVSYRGSAEPQRLSVKFRMSKDVAVKSNYFQVFACMRCIALGYAGGAEFHPTVGQATMVTQPPGSIAREYHFELEVQGMSPFFLRRFVESQRNRQNPLEWLEIKGSLPLDRSALSVREDQVKEWLEGTSVYPKAWPEPEFEIEEEELPRGAFVQVELAGPSTAKLLKEFEACVSQWTEAISDYPNAAETKVRPLPQDPQLGRRKTTLTARYPDMDVAFEPARDSLINGLIRFHHKVASIQRVEIGL